MKDRLVWKGAPHGVHGSALSNASFLAPSDEEPGFQCPLALHLQGLRALEVEAVLQQPEGARRSEFDFPIVDKERTWKILDAMAPIAKAHNCSAARIALAWLLTRPFVTSVIIGAKRLDQLQDNLAAVEVELSGDEIRVLNEVSALPPEYPGWMLEFQGMDRLGANAEPRFEKFSTAHQS